MCIYIYIYIYIYYVYIMYTYITLHCINLHYIYTYIYGIIEYVYTLFSSTVFSHFMAQAIQPTNLPTIDRISNQFCPSTCTFDTQLSRPQLPALRLRGAMAQTFGLGCPNVVSQQWSSPWSLQREPFGGYPLVNVYITMENHHFQWVNPL